VSRCGDQGEVYAPPSFMVLALGIDLVEVARIERAMRRGGFVERVLHPSERNRPITPAYVAGRWAAKEAVKKCCPWVSSWHDVVVLSNPQPSAKVLGMPHGEHVIISITHERTHAAAVAVRHCEPKASS